MSPKTSSGVHPRASETDQMPWCLQLAIRTRTSSPTCAWTVCESILDLTFLVGILVWSLTSHYLTRSDAIEAIKREPA